MNEEKKRILELVQNGKLSAQEAIILLEALEEKTEQKVEKDNHEEASQSAKDEKQTKSEDTSKAEKETDYSSDTIFSQIENAGEKIFEFVQNAFNKLKDFDFQLNQSVEIPHTFQQDVSDARKIDIDLSNGPVRIKTWDQPEIRIECTAKVYRTEDREEARNFFLENTVFNYENGLLVFATRSKWMKVEAIVYIPKKHYDKISIRAFNGGVKGQEIEADSLAFKTTNGKVDISNINGANLDIDTVNGQIYVTESQLETIDAETVNGAIHIAGKYRDVELQSVNGNIECQFNGPVKRVETKNITGNIHVTIPAGAGIDGDVRSNIGNYKLTLNDIEIMREKQEIIQKQVKFKRNGDSDEYIHLLADTKTGTVTVNEAEIVG